MTRSFLAAAISAALVLPAGPAFAQKGQGGSKGKGHVTQTAKGHGGGHAQAGPKTQGGGRVTKGTSGSAAKAAKPAPARGPKSTAPPAATGGTAAATTRGKGKGAASAHAGTTGTLTPVQRKLQQNTNLSSRLQTRLPSGTNLMTAADGFRNLGQFVAAVNVSNNLDIPFSQLKTRMVDDGMSLGQAIQSVRGDVDVRTEVRRAERDATRLIDGAERQDRTKNTAKKRDGGR